jgi:Ca2+-binding RTX toxin-like protein
MVQDQLTGGEGADNFLFAALSHSGLNNRTRDVVNDFEDGIDKIDVDTIVAVTGGIDQEFTFGGRFLAGHIRAVQSGADTILRFNVDDDSQPEMTILLANKQVGDVDGNDFLL